MASKKLFKMKWAVIKMLVATATLIVDSEIHPWNWNPHHKQKKMKKTMGFQTRVAKKKNKKLLKMFRLEKCWKKTMFFFRWKKNKPAMPKNAWRCCFSPKVFKATSHCAARARTDKTWCPLGKVSKSRRHVGFVGAPVERNLRNDGFSAILGFWKKSKVQKRCLEDMFF